METMACREVLWLIPADMLAALWAGVELTQGMAGVGSPEVLMEEGGWGEERGGRC